MNIALLKISFNNIQVNSSSISNISVGALNFSKWPGAGILHSLEEAF